MLFRSNRYSNQVLTGMGERQKDCQSEKLGEILQGPGLENRHTCMKGRFLQIDALFGS